MMFSPAVCDRCGYVMEGLDVFLQHTLITHPEVVVVDT